ncbi:MAG: hypothetical protein MI702_05740, partial [Chlorobiales bacterium]|nr:hypothetical protein [Chlorobiales bacterium]
MTVDRRVAQGIRFVGVVGLIGLVAGCFVSLRHALHAYLVAWSFATTTALGCLFFILFHHVTAARWSTVVRRLAEHVVGALPWLAIGALPILLGVTVLYGWTGHDSNPLLQHKRPYLNVPFFVVRMIIYLTVWALIAEKMRRRSFEQDTTRDPGLTMNMRRWSGPSLIALALTLSFASFDLLMSLEYAWYSTIFGVYVFAGGIVAGHALLAIVARLPVAELKARVTEDTRHDLGKWIFAFAVFWMYITFSQFMLIYYANIPEETEWMTNRWQGSWRIIVSLVVICMFLFPFTVLMSATTKKLSRVLLTVCGVVLFGHFLEMIVLVMPVMHPEGYAVSYVWMDISALVLVLGLTGFGV